MSSREPLWYCHECHAEMHPLMVPDPHCASCNGTFVEKLENTADDPRNFAHAITDDDDPFGQDNFLFGLQNLLRVGERPSATPRSPPLGGGPPLFGSSRTTPASGGTSGYTIHINRSSAPGERTRTTISTGSPRTSDIPMFSEFVRQHGGRPGPGQDRDAINGPLMFQYLLAMLSQPGRNGAMADLFEGMTHGGTEPGRMGDYVFNQEALDQIITQLMENSSSHPAPATEEVMEKLPREVLEEKSPLLEKDCAVCKEQFQLGTEDPDEQVVVTLPCKHPFHEPCIIPWLKSSGTCPVCRYQLVPQPSHHAPGPGPPTGSSSGNGSGDANGPNATGQRSPGQQGPPGGPAGIFGSLFNLLGGNAHTAASGSNINRNNSSGNDTNNGATTSSSPPNRSPRHSRSSSDPDARRHHQSRRPTRRDTNNHEFPGGWNDVD